MTGFPPDLGKWHFLQDAVVEPEIRDFLRADDSLSRIYLDPAATRAANPFVAAFRTLSNGAAPIPRKIAFQPVVGLRYWRTR
jgi:hypothetical protein